MADLLETLGDWLGLNKGKATQKAAEQNRGLIGDFAPVGRDIISGIQSTSDDYLDLGKLGAGLYADAYGVNGADGAARAREAFQTGPGYEFGMDQGLQALERNASKYGRSNSGQTDLDLMKYATGYADQAYGDWLGGLRGYNDMYGAGVDRSNSAAGLGLDFESGLTSAYMGANNQNAAGKEAGQGAMLDALGAIAGIGGKFSEAMKPKQQTTGGGTFGGYGGFGG